MQPQMMKMKNLKLIRKKLQKRLMKKKRRGNKKSSMKPMNKLKKIIRINMIKVMISKLIKWINIYLD
jgi:hypothetical protein